MIVFYTSRSSQSIRTSNSTYPFNTSHTFQTCTTSRTYKSLWTNTTSISLFKFFTTSSNVAFTSNRSWGSNFTNLSRRTSRPYITTFSSLTSNGSLITKISFQTPISRGFSISLQSNATTIISLDKIYQFATYVICCNLSSGNLHRDNIVQYIYMAIISTNGSNKCTIYIRVQSVRCKSKRIALVYLSNIVPKLNLPTVLTTFFTASRFPSGPFPALSPNTLTILLDCELETVRRKVLYSVYSRWLSTSFPNRLAHLTHHGYLPYYQQYQPNNVYNKITVLFQFFNTPASSRVIHHSTINVRLREEIQSLFFIYLF